MIRRLLLFFILLLFSINIWAQEESPLIVFRPVVSSTVFTNWQEIKVTYTVGYLDGYELVLDEIRPDNMLFSPFELDPVKGRQIIKINQRRYKEENYFDLVYYLRLVDIKKGEVAISPQIFKYVKKEAGKSPDKLEVMQFISPGVSLRYDSVLTKEANDIMDDINFGSFRNREIIFEVLAFSIFGLGLISAILILFKSSFAQSKIFSLGTVSVLSAPVDEIKEKPTSGEALDNLIYELKELALQSKTKTSETTSLLRRKLCNELSKFIVIYTPGVLGSENHEELILKISQVINKDQRSILLELARSLNRQGELLYESAESGILLDDINSSLQLAEDLKRANSFWFLFANLFKRFKIFGGAR